MPEAIDSARLTPKSPLPSGICARCGGAVDVRSRHLAIDGSVVRVFCSHDCAREPAPGPTLPAPAPPRRSRWRRTLLRAAVALPMLVFASGPAPSSAPAAVTPATAPPAPPAAAVTAAVPRFGPNWPPSEQEWLAEIAADAWLHPLDGPTRRMPVRDARVFGAERPGDRPAECRNGHCGVDIGGEVWGEPIHAAHDGVVDRVQRGPNEEHGGLYVRLAHRSGTIFTQYFHLAAIPRWIQPGLKVKMGDVVGLLGDSGVKHSTAHLHFTVSVRPSPGMPEQYIDPEPLIALWPLRMPVNGAAMVTAQAAPGVPRGSVGRRRWRAPKPAGTAPAASAPADPDSAASE
jgi:murein DD-endopeptidase MepM/ murein hydrolase activator NlpD